MNLDQISNDEIGLSEKIKRVSKSIIFNVFSPLLLSESYFSLTLKIIVFIIETIQILSFSFRVEVREFWSNDSWSDSIYSFFCYFLLAPYFRLTNYNTYIIFLYVLSVGFFWILMSSIYIGYVFSQNSKKNYSKGFLIGVVKIFNEFLPQVLFLPIFDFFFSFYRCVVNEKGDLVNEIFTEVICYQGDYILHAVIAGFAFASFLVYSILNILCFFEIRNRNLCSKLTSKYDFLFMIFKVVLEISFSLLSQGQNIILIAIFSVGSMLLFEIFNKTFIYYSDFVSRLDAAQKAFIAWTGIMLVFSKVTFLAPFNVYIYLWIVGLLVITIISFSRIRIKYDFLIGDSENFAKESSSIESIDYYLFALNYYTKDKNISIALDGFIEYHKTFCKEPACPSRKDFSVKSRKNSAILGHENENVLRISHLMNVIFFKALQRFPNSVSLRIRYCLFLLDRMGQKQNALQELLSAQSYKLNFDEEFLTFRLKNIIEKDIYEENVSSQNFEFNELFIKDLIKSTQDNIEKSSSLYLEFWNLLSEDCPNLSRLKETGIKMAGYHKLIERNQKILGGMNVYIPKIQLLYSKYLMTIIQDKEASLRVLEKIEEKNQKNKILTVYFSEYFNDHSALAIISGDDKSLGTINHVSLSLSSYLGYTRAELINRKVNMLMPNFYAQNHDKFLEDYMATLEPRIINKQVEIPVKAKSNYIKKASICVKVYNTILQGAQFLGMFTFEKTVKQYCYLICDTTGNILEFSSSCLAILNLDRKKIIKRKIQISDLAPDFFNYLNELKTNAGMDMNIHILEGDDNKLEDERTYGRDNSISTMNVHIVNEIVFKHTNLLGYFVRLEPRTPISGLFKEKLEIKKSSHDSFILQFDLKNKIYMGGFSESKIEDFEGRSNFLNENFGEFNDVAKKEMMISENRNEEEKEDFKETNEIKNYGLNIRTLRLVNNKLCDLEELRLKENENEENEEDNENNLELSPVKGKMNENEPINELEDELDENEENEARYKSLPIFRQFLNQQKSQKFDHFQNLKYVGLVLLIVLIVLSLVNFFISKSELNEILNNHDFIALSNKRTSEVMTILNSVNQLFLLNNQWINSEIYNENNLRNILNNSIFKLSLIENKISLDASTCSALRNEDINIHVKFSTNNATFDINQITSQIISKAYNLLKNSSLEAFTSNNMDLLFLRENILQYYPETLRNISNNCIDYVDDSINKSNRIIIVFLVLATLTIFMAWITILYVILVGVRKFEQEILKVFLCLPIEKVKILLKSSEDFNSQFKIGDVDYYDGDSSNSNITFADEEDEMKDFKFKLSKKKRKKFLMEKTKYKYILMYTFLFMMLLEAYFLGSFAFSNNVIQELKTSLNEFNATASFEPSLSFYNNILRELIMDEGFVAISEGTLNNIFLMRKINLFYDDFSFIQKEHLNNLGLRSHYDQIYSNYFEKNSCLYLENNFLGLNCTAFSNGIFTQGLKIVLPKYFENERYIVSLWNYFVSYSDASLEFLNITPIIYSDLSLARNNLVNLFQLDILENTNIFQENFIKNLLNSLIDEFYNGIKTNYDQTDLQSLVLIICFFVFLITSFGLVWLPFIASLKKDNLLTANLLLMIPLKFIRESPILIKSIEQNFK